MTQHWLEDLMLISYEKDISKTLDHENILDSFIPESAVLSKHLI